jgi:hypothetical protein
LHDVRNNDGLCGLLNSEHNLVLVHALSSDFRRDSELFFIT